MPFPVLSVFLGLIGFILLILALYPANIRSPDLAPEMDSKSSSEALLAPHEALTALQREPSESDFEYLQRSTGIMHRSILHYWPDDNRTDAVTARVPLMENYILWLLSFLPTGEWEHFKKYAFWDYEKAIQRGFGLCRQHAQAMYTLLNSHGIDARYIALNGHVVVQATTDEGVYIADSDYEVIIPHSISEIREDPSTVREFYAASPRVTRISELSSVLEAMEDNYSPPYSAANPEKQIFIERLSYFLTWVGPMILLSIALGSILWP